METDVGQLAPFVDPQRNHVGHERCKEGPECCAGQLSHELRRTAQDENGQRQNEEENVQAYLQRRAQRIHPRGHNQSAAVRTRTPCGATRTGSTVAPSRTITSATRSFAPRSTRKKTQPPPPAPQAFAPTAPARRVASTRRSI